MASPTPTPAQIDASASSSLTAGTTATIPNSGDTPAPEQVPTGTGTNVGASAGTGEGSSSGGGGATELKKEPNSPPTLPMQLDDDRAAPPLSRKDKSLQQFLGQMDEYAPIIPDAVTDYYLALAGLSTSDTRLKRLLALATQKFISDLASDAFQYSKIRQGGGGQGAVGGQMGQGGVPGVAAGAEGKKGGRTVLTMEDLGCAVAEYGVDVRRGEFYR